MPGAHTLVDVKPAFPGRVWLVSGGKKPYSHKPRFSAPEVKLLAASNEVEDRVLEFDAKFFSVPRNAPPYIACLTATLTDNRGRPLSGEAVCFYISSFHPEGGSVQESGPVGFQISGGGQSSSIIPSKEGAFYTSPGVLSFKTSRSGRAWVYLTVSNARGIANICALHVRPEFKHPLLSYLRIGIGGVVP